MGLFGDIAGLIGGGKAGNALWGSELNAEHGVLDATKNGQAGVQAATNAGQAGVVGANAQNATATSGLQAGLAPYMGAGTQAVTGLESLANNPFSFDPSKYINSPAYNFQLQQGQDAIKAHGAATGAGVSGNTLKDLTSFGQGLASTYYQQAFNNQLNTFDTNRTTLTDLLQPGEFGTGLNASIGESQMGRNLQAGEFDAQLGQQGSEFGANLGMQGAKTAGDFAVGAGQAHASKIMNKYQNLGGLGDDIMGMALPMLPGVFGPTGPSWMPDFGTVH
jgi:hypothetical protein